MPVAATAASTGYLTGAELPSSQQLPAETALPRAIEQALYGEIVGQWETDPDSPICAGSPAGGDIYDGCLPAAQTEILGGGDPSRAFSLTDFGYRLKSLSSEAEIRVVTSQEWLDREQLWSQCMSEMGFSYIDIRAAVGQVWPTPRPSTRELQTAQADAGCRTTAGIYDFAPVAYARYLEASTEQRAAELAAMSAELDAITARSVAAMEQLG